MSQLGKVVGDLVEVLMDFERRLADIEAAVADICIADKPASRTHDGRIVVDVAEWERLQKIEDAARRASESWMLGEDRTRAILKLREAMKR